MGPGAGPGKSQPENSRQSSDRNSYACEHFPLLSESACHGAPLTGCAAIITLSKLLYAKEQQDVETSVYRDLTLLSRQPARDGFFMSGGGRHTAAFGQKCPRRSIDRLSNLPAPGRSLALCDGR